MPVHHQSGGDPLLHTAVRLRNNLSGRSRYHAQLSLGVPIRHRSALKGRLM